MKYYSGPVCQLLLTKKIKIPLKIPKFYLLSQRKFSLGFLINNLLTDSKNVVNENSL